ncbi:MAG: AmmeMemoRadiSam system radical SAM enzyme [Firmicutes bacterium]|nr:AmmeMemoRadiSam system radical SAM enzyme [Bacillota bacterium]
MSEKRLTDAECGTCFRRCRLKEGQYGFCGARRNLGGRIECVNYGRLTSLALDPVEKKPFAEFHPGSLILSCGSFGCNLTCPFCQNHTISRAFESSAHWSYASPETIADQALELADQGNLGVAFTYNEAMIGWEFVRDTAAIVHRHGLLNAVVTNGSVGLEALEAVLPYVDAFNIDLKCFSEDSYKKLGGDFETVKSFIIRASKDAHVEVTSLIVPGFNDDAEEMDRMAGWLASVDESIPLHITRFFPMYRVTDRPPTPLSVLRELRTVAEKHLRSVYLGNV